MTTTTSKRLTFEELQPEGSVSWGTLRPTDLAQAFLREIDSLRLGGELPAGLRAAAERLASHASEICPDPVEGEGETIDELLDFLNDRAPDGWVLQPLEGDGSDYCWQPVTLRAMLQQKGARHLVGPFTWENTENEAMTDIIDRFDDCPDGLRDFQQSDWVNLCECYTADLLCRWDAQKSDIKALFDDYCENIGATSTMEALEGESIDDPHDFIAAYVNKAMTWAGMELLREIEDFI